MSDIDRKQQSSRASSLQNVSHLIGQMIPIDELAQLRFAAQLNSHCMCLLALIGPSSNITTTNVRSTFQLQTPSQTLQLPASG
jgi:hypothetical protein